MKSFKKKININEHFVPYTESSELNHLGFDEPCLGTINNNEAIHIKGTRGTPSGNVTDEIPVPTFGQTFKWFEDKYSIFVEREVVTTVNEIFDIVYRLKSWKFSHITISFENPYDCFDKHKAELQCVKKLIEIVKDGNK